MPEPHGRAVLVLALIVAALAAACDGLTGASGSAGASAARATLPPAAAATADPAASVEPLAWDDGLLAVLPKSVANAPIQPSRESAARMIADAALGRTASGVAVGGFVGTDVAGDDLAVASVVQLRPGIFTDQFFAEWRESYDRAACEPAGGVESHATNLIGQHSVEVTVCHEGALTYHTRLSGDRLVSVTAVGARAFGRLVMVGLRQ